MSIVKKLTILIGSACITHALAGNVYLCGNNEDGCDLTDPASCACVIKDENQASHHYCLNYHDDDNISCDATKINQACPADQESFPDERTCAAVALQSVDTPVCPEQNIELCQRKNIAILTDKNLNKMVQSLNH